MKNFIVYRLQLILILLIASPAFSGQLPYKNINVGPAKVSMGGEYRIRGEYNNNYDIKKYGSVNDDSFLLSRLRFKVSAVFPSSLKTFLQLQDSRSLGSKFDDSDFKGSNPYHDNMDIRQAYINYNLNPWPKN